LDKDEKVDVVGNGERLTVFVAHWMKMKMLMMTS